MDSLVSSDWLQAHLDDPDLRILECTVNLKPSDGGFVADDMRSVWAEGHIPNSVYADLTNDMSDPESNLRFTMWATRVFWMLKAFGFDDCAVLDGGYKTWTNEGRTVSTDGGPNRSVASFTASPRPEMIATLEQVEAAVGDSSTCIINSLSPDNHSGADNSYGRAGHLPGATNVFAVSLVDAETHRYQDKDQLAALFEHLPADQPVITYCGGGIAATSDAFVLTELLGRTDVSVYDGSLSEWVKDSNRPMVLDG